MIKANEERIGKYVIYLRSLLVEEGSDTQILSDDDVLEMFRFCFCCGEEVVSKSEQTHSILEFDTPGRVHKKLYENLNKA